MTSPPIPKSLRLSITVTPEVHAAFVRLSKASGMSIGRAMGEWLGDTLDAVQFTASKVEEARSAPRLVMQEMHAYAMGLADETGAVLAGLRAAGKQRASKPEAPPAASVPPPRPVIRGGTSSKGKPVVPDVPYSALDPLTGKRVVLGAGQYFDKSGVLRNKT